MIVQEEDLAAIGPFRYCDECGEQISDEEEHSHYCDGEVETVYGFLRGGSCHSPVVFDGLGPGDRVVIERGN